MWGKRLGFGIVLLIGCGGSRDSGGGHGTEGGEAGVPAAGFGGARAGSGGSRSRGGAAGDGGTRAGGGVATGGSDVDAGEAGAAGAGGDDSSTGGNSGGSHAGHAGAAGRDSGGNGGNGGGLGGVSGAGGEGGGDSNDCIVFVSAESGHDANDGTSWAASLASVSLALSRAQSGCEVWITEGTYRPGTERTSTFVVPVGVTLRGGFDGTETSVEGRDIATHRTILSGDLGELFVSGDNALHVVTTLGDATLDGLEITGGNANTNGLDRGGGIVAGGLLTLLECTVIGNSSAGNGGGLHSGFGLYALNTTFADNTAQYFGGAIQTDGPDPVSVYDSTFAGNTALYGGGLYAYDGSIAIVAEFVDNAATQGAAVWVGSRSATLNANGARFTVNRSGTSLTNGSIVFSEGTSVFAGVEFVGNVGETIIHTVGPSLIGSSSFANNEGSSVFVRQHIGSCDVVVSDTTFDDNASYRGAAIWSYDCPLHVMRSSFTGNEASDSGGAINYQSSGGELHVENSLFDRNTSAWTGGAINVHYGSARLERTTFTGNSSSYDGGALAGYDADSMLVTSCRFLENEATSGGGAIALLQGPLDVRASEFQKNTARWGGAVYRTLTGGPLGFVNATFSLNVAETGAAIDSHGTVVIRNSILWGDEPAEVVLGTGLLSGGEPDVLTLTANNLTGNYPSLVAADPKFVDPNGNLRLSATSPCIDRADDAFATLVDVDGHARRDEPGLPVCTGPTPSCGSIADMGAYEFGY